MRHSGAIAVGERRKGQPPRILVVDDDDDLRVLIGDTLRADGFEVVEVGESFDLDELLLSQATGHQDQGPPFELVVCELLLSECSGMDVLEEIRNAGWAVPIIAVTATHDLALHHQARKLGAAAVFHKPFEVDDLRMAVLNLLPGAILGDQRSRRPILPVSPH